MKPVIHPRSLVWLLLGFLFLISLGSCSGPARPAGPTVEPELVPRTMTFPGYAAVKVECWGHRKSILLLETLQTQTLVTMPQRKLVWLDEELKTLKEYLPPVGSFLIDFAVHPSGAATALEILPEPGNDLFLKPLKARLTRFLTDGSLSMYALESGILPVVGGNPAFLFSLDRARIVPFGEESRVVMRWSDNSVHAYSLTYQSGTWGMSWDTVIEPPANLYPTGIIGGGFDNFHQGDRVCFVYLDVDETGASYVVVPSTVDVLPAHDSFFHESLLSGADEGHFDYGVSIITKLSPGGARTYSTLSGLGTNKRLLNVRSTSQAFYLTGRIRTGNLPQDWDSWVMAFDRSTGRALAEYSIDIQDGDMFWDLVPLDGSLLAVGSTNYTQNPSGLSVSDQRDNLAVVVDPSGVIQKRLFLPPGPEGRGNEVVSVKVVDGHWAIFAGLNNAPGTHAPVFSDAFVSVRSLD